MARTEVITCDLGADGAATTHRLAFDGKAVEVDVCARHLAALEGALAEYLAAGRPPRRVQVRSAATRRRSAAIRAWAVQEGLLPAGPPKGRIPIDVVAKYEDAHDGGAR